MDFRGLMRRLGLGTGSPPAPLAQRAADPAPAGRAGAEQEVTACVKTGKRLHAHPTLGQGTQGIAFLPDSRTIAICSFRTHRAGAFRLAFSPDGKRLASVGSGYDSATVLIWDVADVMGRALAPAKAGPKDVEEWCAARRSQEASTASREMWALVRSSKQAAGALRAQGRKGRPTPADIGRLIAALDDDDFAAREKAERELTRAGNRAVAKSEAALRNKPSLEQPRRLERVLRSIRAAGIPAEDLFAVRAVQVLKRIASPEARGLLREWAKGPAETRLTREARFTLGRLDRLDAGRPPRR